MSAFPALIVILYLVLAIKAEFILEDDEFSFRNFLPSFPDRNFVKTGAVLSEKSSKDFSNCHIACLDNVECFAVNFIQENSKDPLCQLLNDGNSDYEDYLEEKEGGSYSRVKTACEPNPCLYGSVCSPSADGRNFSCNFTSPAHFGRYCQGRICADFDFEDGNLTGWIQEGTAFRNQPTYGDNSDARGKPSKLHGNWYIGTFENRPSPLYPVGGQQGDAPTGKLTSPSFVIQGPTLKFLIGGGESNTSVERAELLIGGIVVVSETTDTQNEGMIEKSWNVSELIGKTARLRVVDDGDGWWHHINFDYFRDETCAGP